MDKTSFENHRNVQYVAGCQHFCRKLRSLNVCRELLLFSNEKRRNSLKYEEKFVGDLNAAGNNVVKKNTIATWHHAS
jgi:hypothetical protein